VNVTAVAGKPNLVLGAYDLATLGYRAEEFFVSGVARSYAPRSEADYVTRVVILRPIDEAAFNGTVVVEWLNVSGGIDAPAVWLMAHRGMARDGYVYVTVSAQRVGVEGGASLLADMSLKVLDPQRYAPLAHPGDAYSYDIYSQVGRLVRDGAFGDFNPKTVLATGESQSAMFLTTYINEVDALAEVYDGFLVHSRFGPAAPLDGTNMVEHANPVPFGEHLRVPVLAVITETDLIGGIRTGYHQARRPDDDRLRVWEIPGAAHADNYTIKVGAIDDGRASVAAIVAAYAPTDELMGQTLSYCINNSPQHHYVLQAAIAGLQRWVRDGEPAARAPLIELTSNDSPRLVLDGNGIARGGVRTPWVDVPVARASGIGSDENVLAMLFGSVEPFGTERLRQLYPGGAEDFLNQFAEALDRSIASGFILAADRAEILDIAAAAFPLP
jgi:Alpha/beta hydrolase domain